MIKNIFLFSTVSTHSVSAFAQTMMQDKSNDTQNFFGAAATKKKSITLKSPFSSLGVFLSLMFFVSQCFGETVTNTSDTGTGSLRAAVAAGGTVDFASGLSGSTITLASEIVVASNVTVDATSLTGTLTISGNSVTRHFRVTSAGNLTLRKLTFINGRGIGTVSVGFGGAVYNEGTCTIDRCAFSGNYALNYGGAVCNAFASTMTIDSSSFSLNAAGQYGGAVSNSSVLTIKNSTVNQNISSYAGGGIFSDYFGVPTISNCTITKNQASFYGGGLYNGGLATIDNITMVDNSASLIGGGVYNDFFGTVTMRNSIVVRNSAPANPEFFGTWAGSPNFTTGDPELAELGNYGGPTQTMPPLPNSPVIDAGGATALTTDQRGLPRILADGLDMGSFEVAISDFNASGLTLYARVPTTDTTGIFEISTDPNFLPVVSTFAGTATNGLLDGPRLTSQLGLSAAVATDSFGNVFIADTGNNCIRMVAVDGTVTTIAGDGTYGLANGPGPTAKFQFPSALTIGPDSNVYVADTFNHRVCVLERPLAEGGLWNVKSLAGSTAGLPGFFDGAPTAARFYFPYGIAVDAGGNVFVADAYNNRIRKILPSGSVTTYAGAATSGLFNSPNASLAKFYLPKGLVLAGGDLYVADTLNHCIRKIVPDGALAGAVTTFAGSTSGYLDGLATAAKFDSPAGLATDGSGNIFVADERNHRIRKITSVGQVSTIAGGSSPALINGDSNVARFNFPTGVAVGVDGNLIVADTQNNVVRRIVIKPISVPSSVIVGSGNASGIQVSAILDVVALGLDPSITYYFRWKSTTTGLTLPLGHSFFFYDFPLVATNPANPVIPTSARLNATVDPKSSLTDVVFEYSTDPEMLLPYHVSTLAGSGSAGFANDTGVAAMFNRTSGMVTSPSGDAYVADRLNNQIRKITPLGVATTFAGSGVAGFANGTGALAQFESPQGLAIDSLGNLYVADTANHRIRKISTMGEVTTLAGSGIAGFENGAAASAKFLYPTGVALDSAGNVYVADSGNNRIRKIDSVTGDVTTFAGNGVSGFADGENAVAQFSSPRALAVGTTGSLLVVDSGNHRVRLIDASGVTTLSGTGTAGFADGAANSAQFSSPTGIALDSAGIAYVSDSGNHRIRRIAVDGSVTTIAGSGVAGQENSPSIGLYPATSSQFDSPASIALDGAGGLLVSQQGLIRKIGRALLMPTVVVTPTPSGTGSRVVSADISEPLLPGATYYFRAIGTNYRGVVTGSILSFTTPVAAISVFAGADTSSPAVAHLQVDAEQFGTTPTGQPITRTFTISNPGAWPLTVSSIVVPSGYQYTGGVATIPSLNSLTFDLTLQAASGGSFAGNVTIASNAPGQTVFTFPVNGVALDPPVVTTLEATDLAAGTATFHARVNPKGSSTLVSFEWSLDPEFDGVNVSTCAGSTSGYVDALGVAAKFDQPTGLATDVAGNVYVADTMNHRIRKIAPDGGVTTFAGTGVAGFADGAAATAQFNKPTGIVVSATGVIFVADSLNHRIRAINAAGDVVTFAGLGAPGFTDGIPTAARFNVPTGIAIDGASNLYVADSLNHRVRKIATTGVVSTLAGSGVAGKANGLGVAAEFNTPLSIAVDSSGSAYVTEFFSHSIRKISSSGQTTDFVGSSTVANSSNGSGAGARFSSPNGLAFGKNGLLYVADRGNQRIRTVTSAGFVSTVAGTGSVGAVDGFGDVASFNLPFSVATTASGTVIVGESGNSLIRKIVSLQVIQESASPIMGTSDVAVDLAITGLPTVGTCYYRAIATNGGGTTIGNTLPTTTLTFRQWQINEFGANADNPLVAGPSVCAAGDGVSNLLKYALGVDPYDTAAAALPVMALNGGNMTLTYSKAVCTTNILFSVQWSTDLVSWSTAGVSETILSDDGVYREIRASVSAAPATSKFMRLCVTLPE